MKTMKLLLGLALIVSVASPAVALTLNPADFAGAISIDIDNWEVSPVYGYPTDPFTLSVPADDLDNDGNVADDNKIGGEDSTWGIFAVNGITDIDNNQTVFTQGYNGQYLAGVFYGIQDQNVEWTGIFSENDQDNSGDRSVGDTASGRLTVEGSGLTFELYNLPSETWNETNGASAGAPGSYAGITDQGLLPELVATSAVNSSNISPLNNTVEYYSSVVFNLVWDGQGWVPTTANGDFRAVLDAVGGTNVDQWDHDWVNNTAGPNNDITIQGNLTLST
ncbi:MAG: hypothetical protein ACOCZE_05450, partial [Planctomycetota bacterium]